MRLREGDDTRPRVVCGAVAFIAWALVGVYLAIVTNPVGILWYEQRGSVLSVVYAPSGECGQVFGVRVREVRIAGSDVSVDEQWRQWGR